MTVIIRDAEQADIPRMLELAEAFHAWSHYRDLPFDQERVSVFLNRLIGHAEAKIWVAVDAGDVVAGIGGMMIQSYFTSSWICQELFWFVGAPERHRLTAYRLLLKLKEWGKIRGAAALVMSAFSDTRPEKFYQAAGMVKTETVWRGNC